VACAECDSQWVNLADNRLGLAGGWKPDADHEGWFNGPNGEFKQKPPPDMSGITTPCQCPQGYEGFDITGQAMPIIALLKENAIEQERTCTCLIGHELALTTNDLRAFFVASCNLNPRCWLPMQLCKEIATRLWPLGGGAFGFISCLFLAQDSMADVLTFHMCLFALTGIDIWAYLLAYIGTIYR
jgi:hypothetical protein